MLHHDIAQHILIIEDLGNLDTVDKWLEGDKDTGSAFRDYNYMQVRYLLDPNGKPGWGCMETGSGMSMIDSTLLAELPWVERILAKEPVKVRGLGDTVYKSWETVVMSIYLPDESGTNTF